jgi:hypothetical protein
VGGGGVSVGVKYIWHAFPVCELSHIKRQRSSQVVRYCAEPGCGQRLARLNTGLYCYRHDALHADEELARELAAIKVEPELPPEVTITADTPGPAIRALILAHGITVAAAARAVGMNPQTLYHYTQEGPRRGYQRLPEKYRRALFSYLNGEEVRR